MSITEYREAYKPVEGFEFPLYFQSYHDAFASLWRPQEVDMSADVKDWQMASDIDREVIGGILKGFTQTETFINDYWSQYVSKLFPKHEILAMCSIYSLQEVVHAEAYNLLSDTLGINEFEAFLGDPVAKKKLDILTYSMGPKTKMGVFSGAMEGVSLFSSFAVLLSFNLTGRFKGLAQIISWSALDEQRHSDAACSLFRQYIRETGISEGEKQSIYDGFSLILNNERKFLDQAFDGNTVNGVHIDNIMAYLYARSNDRLREMGIYDELKYSFSYDPKLSYEISEWFEPMMRGLISHDFFSSVKEGSSYIAKPTQKWNEVDLKTLDLTW